MNSPEFTPEPRNWPFWAQREKIYNQLNLKIIFCYLGDFHMNPIGLRAKSGENISNRCCPPPSRHHFVTR